MAERPKIRAVPWSDIHRDACRLAALLRPLGAWRGLIAVTRGGLVPAAIVIAADDGTGMLVIDDLVDSGQTAQMVRQLLPQAFVACLYAKPLGRPYVDLFVEEIEQLLWIEFPWERDPGERDPGEHDPGEHDPAS